MEQLRTLQSALSSLALTGVRLPPTHFQRCFGADVRFPRAGNSKKEVTVGGADRNLPIDPVIHSFFFFFFLAEDLGGLGSGIRMPEQVVVQLGSCFSKVSPPAGPAQTWPIKATSGPSSYTRKGNVSALGAHVYCLWWSLLLLSLSAGVQRNCLIQN